jgi:hypothetical protein
LNTTGNMFDILNATCCFDGGFIRQAIVQDLEEFAPLQQKEARTVAAGKKKSQLK